MGPTRSKLEVCPYQRRTRSRSHSYEIGLEILRQLHNRFALPIGTRSIGYLTRLLKPTFDTNNFEESFSVWEFELNKYERDNNTQLPDAVKIAVLLNETRDKRSTSTTPAVECRYYTLYRCQNNNNGVLQDYNGFQQTSPSSIVKCGNKLQWRSCPDGHRSHQQRSQRKERT